MSMRWWVDVDKGNNGQVDIKRRFVVRDFTPCGEQDRFDPFAPMPLWEAKRLLFKMAADLTNKEQGQHVLVLINVRKAG